MLVCVRQATIEQKAGSISTHTWTRQRWTCAVSSEILPQHAAPLKTWRESSKQKSARKQRKTTPTVASSLSCFFGLGPRYGCVFLCRSEPGEFSGICVGVCFERVLRTCEPALGKAEGRAKAVAVGGACAAAVSGIIAALTSSMQAQHKPVRYVHQSKKIEQTASLCSHNGQQLGCCEFTIMDCGS